MDSLCTGWTHLAQALRGLCSFGVAWTAFAQGWTHLAQAPRSFYSLGKAWTVFAQDGHTLHRLLEVPIACGKHGQSLHRMDTLLTGS